MVVVRSCSVARVGCAKLLGQDGLIERWHGGVLVAQCDHVELLSGMIETAGCGLYFEDVFGDVGSVLGSRYRPRETLAMIPNMMYLKGENQRRRKNKMQARMEISNNL